MPSSGGCRRPAGRGRWRVFGLALPVEEWAKEEGIAEEEIHQAHHRGRRYARGAKRGADIGPELMRHIEKRVLLETVDRDWREHIVMLDHLRQVVGLRGYGQRDPLNEYETESFTLFEHMLARLREAVTGQLMHVELAKQEDVPPLEQAELPPMEAHHLDPTTGEDEFALEPANGGGDGRGAAKPAQRPQGSGGRESRRCGQAQPGRSFDLGQGAA